MRFLPHVSLLALGSLATSVVATATPRFLEDYATASHMQFGKCVRIKVQENNDDDGNSYFYNGAYRSQYLSYASFYLCDGCGSCNTNTEYVTSLESFLESSVEYVQEYCNQCSEQCRRRLEDADQQDGGYDGYDGNAGGGEVDCSSCSSNCQSYGNSGNSGSDESQYLYCQASFEDDGIQIYSAPTCGGSGGLVMGLFYDDACTIKRTDQSDFSDGFSYNTFETIQSMCTDCSDTDMCSDFSQSSLICNDGTNDNANVDEDGMQVCKRYKQASKERIYAKDKRKLPLSMDIVFLAVFLCGLSTFLSYTYYLRHRNRRDNSDDKDSSLMENEELERNQSQVSYGQMT